MTEQTTKSAIEALGASFAEFKAANDASLDEIRKNGAPDPVTIDKVDKLEKAVSDAVDLKDRIDALEASANRKPTGGESQISPESDAHKTAFVNWLRDPSDNEAAQALRAAQRDAHAAQVRDQKAVTVGTAAAGGYAMPEEIGEMIHNKVLDISPLRRLVRVTRAGSADYKELVDVNGGAGGWVGETGSRSETDTPSLAECAPTFGTCYAYPKASEESLQDIFFDVQTWLVNSAARELAKLEGAAIISGDGSNKPTGFLNATPSSSGDEESPARAFGTLEYLPTGAAAGFGDLATSSPVHYPGDVLLDMIYALKADYRANAQWLSSKATAAVVRKMKDANGDYLWTPGLAAGQPNSLCGYDHVEAEDMPAIGANAYPLAIGDWQQAYLLVDLVDTLRISVDDNITAPGYVKFYVRRRVGGKTLNDDAAKLAKCATS